MPHEQTPLIATSRVGPPRRRYPHNVLRRFCTIALSSTLIWFLLAIFFTAIVHPDRLRRPRHGHHDHGHRWSWPSCPDRKLTHERLREILLETPDPKEAEQWSHYYTSGPHLAGQNYSQATWTKDKWEQWGVASEIVAYDVYLNRPVDHRLALLNKTRVSSSSSSSWTLAFEASLEEDVLRDDPTTSAKTSVPTFHGYSATGNVTAPFVFVNYGTFQDFEDLRRANVSLEGKIAIARYGGIFRGLKVKRAQELGMVGTVLYSDPGDDGENTAEKGEKLYPKGPARQPTSVQRGSAQFINIAPGDPTTPGYPSKPGVPRGPVEDYTPSIPSIPISYADALPLLKALNGHGPQAKDFNKYWSSNLGLGYKGVDYNVGPTPDDIVLNLYNEQEYITTPIWNVIGVINGTIQDEVVVVGNHRDAWIVGGAADPNSGSAVINEVIRSFGKAMEEGWRPLRTIVFASWDGEEYALLGSTEWVEEYLPWISQANVAYINVDVGVSGANFEAAAAPLLHKLLYEATAAVKSPNQTVEGQTVADVWHGNIRTMGSGSDFTAFQDFAGVPCLEMGFKSGAKDPVYHYHSNYDSFHWMETFGDPGFVYHRAMAQILGVVVAELSDVPVVPLRATDYAHALGSYVDKAEKKLEASLHPAAQQDDGQEDRLSDEEVFELRASHRSAEMQQKKEKRDEAQLGDSSASMYNPDAVKRGLAALHRAVWELTKKAVDLDQRADYLAKKAGEGLPWWKWPAKLKLGWDIREVNTKYKLLERNFLYPGGLDGRPWFKHVVFAPGLWTGYAGAVFPGITESIDAEDYENAIKWVDIIDDCLVQARKSL